MDSAPEIPPKEKAKNTKIGKFADLYTALPTGKSSIKIIKDSETRDLKTATEDTNRELESLSEGIKIDVIKDSSNETAPELEPLNLDDTEVKDQASDEVPEIEEVSSIKVDETEEVIVDVEPNDEVIENISINEDGIPDDPVTVKAIEDIVAQEADLVLEAEDEDRELTEIAKSPKKRSFIARLFSHSSFRWGLFVFTLLITAGIGFTPQTRYYLLNTSGVRSTMSLKVIDSETQLPLKNVSVSAGTSVAETDSEGIARLTDLPLGDTKLIIEKRAFSSVEKSITIGWGSNPIGEFPIKAIGAQYTFIIKDFLSGKPIEGAQASSGDGNAISDKDGKLIITLDTANLNDDAQVEILISSENYRDEKVSVNVANKEVQSVEMVSARKHSFVSKRSGKYDVYSIDIDGKNEQKIVQGTGLERDDIAYVPNQKSSTAALVSTRERATSPSGYLLSTLYIVDTSSGSLIKVDQSEKINIIGWSKTGRLIYVKIANDVDGTDPERHRIVSVNSQNIADTKQLASANAFNDILIVGDRVIYAPSNAFIQDTSPGVYSVNVLAEDRQTILEPNEAFQLQRTSYEAVDINIGSSWYSFSLNGGSKAIPSQQPSSQTNRFYYDNYNNNFSLWVDKRDDKGVLLVYDKVARKDRELANIIGLKTPIYWLDDNVVVFRVKDSKETADYVVNTDSGEARKIISVADSLGTDRNNNY